jgi:periplasmic copper chaperone A
MLNTIKLIANFLISTLVILLFSLPSAAQTEPEVKVEGAWIRGTAQGQSGTGGFMTITAKQSMRLVGITSPVAGTAEVHEMKMDGDVMRMRALPSLELPAGKAVELKSGGNHMMLMDLNQTLKYGSTVPITLLLTDALGKPSQITLQVPVVWRAPKP